MRYKTLIFITFFSVSIIKPQESIRMKFGNGTSTLSDFSIEIQDGDESIQIDINRLRSTLRDLDFQLEGNYNNEFVKMILNLASATADGISIGSKNNKYLPNIKIGKLSYSLNDWDIHFVQDGPIGDPVLSAKISLQQINLVPPKIYTTNLSKNTWDILKVFYKEGSLSGKKVSVEFTLDENRLLKLNVQIDLPVGKAFIESDVSLPKNFNGEPYIESAKINLTGLTPGIRDVIDTLLANSNKLPLKKKGTGYQLQFRGEFNSPIFY